MFYSLWKLETRVIKDQHFVFLLTSYLLNEKKNHTCIGLFMITNFKTGGQRMSLRLWWSTPRGRYTSSATSTTAEGWFPTSPPAPGGPDNPPTSRPHSSSPSTRITTTQCRETSRQTVPRFSSNPNPTSSTGRWTMVTSWRLWWSPLWRFPIIKTD